jgi:hypothetical protein
MRFAEARTVLEDLVTGSGGMTQTDDWQRGLIRDGVKCAGELLAMSGRSAEAPGIGPHCFLLSVSLILVVCTLLLCANGSPSFCYSCRRQVPVSQRRMGITPSPSGVADTCACSLVMCRGRSKSNSFRCLAQLLWLPSQRIGCMCWPSLS